MLIGELEYMIKRGWEISWFTTNNKSFAWEDINSNIRKFLKSIKTLDFERADIGFFNPITKRTVYECYELTDNDM